MQKKITWTAKDGTLLQQLLQLTYNQKMPIGITVRDRSTLCEVRVAHTYIHMDASQIIDILLKASGYKWYAKDDLLQVRPLNGLDELETRVLQAKLQTFGGMETTIQGLGEVLSGYVLSILFPGQGYAGDIPSSSKAETVKAFTLWDVSVEQAANYIVSHSGKGAWLVYTTGRPSEKQFRLRTFGYTDDAAVLRDTKCVPGE